MALSDSPRFRPRFSAASILPGAVLLLAALLPLPAGGHIAGIPSLCMFNRLTGQPCPGCGLTRSFVCLAHGHFAEAFRYHPLGPLLFLGAVLWLGLTFVPGSGRYFEKHAKWISVLLGTALLLIWMARLSGWLADP